MHTQVVHDISEITTAHVDFLAWIQSFLDPDKFRTFEKLFRLPLPTNEICENIFQEFPRSVQARNKYLQYSFVNVELEQEFRNYLTEISFDDFWSGAAFEALAMNINSFVVIDLPMLQGTAKRPNPYFYLLDIEAVMDVQMTKGKVDWIIFLQDVTPEERQAGFVEKKAIMDSVSIKIMGRKKDTDIWIELLNMEHGLGFCPVCKFYPQLLSEKNPLNSKSPISPALSDLDKWLFWNISIDHFKLYGAFPIYWGYKQTCNYQDPQTGGNCDGNGHLIWFEGVAGQSEMKQHSDDCPVCKNKRILGAGSYIEVLPPQMKEDADLRDPVGKLEVQVDALKFITESNANDKNDIIYNCTGKASDSLLKTQAVNETQAKSSFETRQTIISGVARNFEKTMWFMIDTLARLRYGTYFLGCTVDLGNDFFLKTPDELTTDYTASKSAGRAQFELKQKREFMFLTENQNNEEALMRYEILKALEPYQGYTLQELCLMSLQENDKISYIIKVNFGEFVDRFERENIGIIEFGKDISFQKKIELIKQQLIIYANEKSFIQPQQRPPNPGE